jgi:ABC-type phosphate/phosphonate transport system substrate-binding protein
METYTSMKTHSLVKFLFIFFAVCNTTYGLAQTKLILSAPPRETYQAGQEQYGLIAEGLSKILGMEVMYEHPDNWTQYATKMRAGKYDIVFDGPHFAAWRMKHVNHAPVARLPDTLKFLIVARADDNQIKSLRDLIGKQICGLASPNLGTVAVFSLYDNPVIQPEIKVINGGMRNVVQAFFRGECRAAVVRDKVYLSLPPEKRDLVKIIDKSEDMPNQTITVSTKISVYNRDKIQKYLTSSEGAKSAEKLLSVYSRNNKAFIPVNVNEYENLEKLIEDVVYGW